MFDPLSTDSQSIVDNLSFQSPVSLTIAVALPGSKIKLCLPTPSQNTVHVNRNNQCVVLVTEVCSYLEKLG